MILEAAKEFGKAPWELDDSEPPLTWLIRWKALRELRAKLNG